ncbi:hypothetical protein N7513_001599 [Penicillium frequentans]|nr:hypothetical protein N7513_001599 [Penicillium glabrum]
MLQSTQQLQLVQSPQIQLLPQPQAAPIATQYHQMMFSGIADGYASDEAARVPIGTEYVASSAVT